MTAEEKLARHRLSVLELAQVLGNVSEACRHRGMTRTQFYDYKRRFELQGLEGLKDLPPIHKTHPQTTPPEVAEQILALSLAHPAWGCVRLSAHLKLDGITVSSPTVQSILIKHGMGSKFDRLLKLEEKTASEPIELTGEQIAQIEKANPCFRERHVESSRPGELLCQDTLGYLRIPSSSAPSKASAKSTCTPSWIPTAPMALGSCIPARSPRRRSRCCITMCCPSTRTGPSPWRRCSPTTAASSVAPMPTPTSS